MLTFNEADFNRFRQVCAPRNFLAVRQCKHESKMYAKKFQAIVDETSVRNGLVLTATDPSTNFTNQTKKIVFFLEFFSVKLMCDKCLMSVNNGFIRGVQK